MGLGKVVVLRWNSGDALAAAAFAFILYGILYKLLFDNFEDFVSQMRGTIGRLVIAVVLDSLLNWSPTSEKISFRFIAWAVTGVLGWIGMYWLLAVSL